ncbi:hypothetical protein GCM10018793_05570 [Streptomyces sulfonofaciens]|uniref:Cellulase n=1 Tax=Streptomyces sulfonofaciens TaxID=68272 RepID=A0A919KSL0_9ACTN|nr:cellulase [Streptomyces sulfonofaciens]GHH70857.1 hypothetical protein GCM10018793_05570 [Streptomyces sulfonofaciens]
MDHFERQLVRMMRDAEAPAPFEPRHRERLWAGVRVRRRKRAARRAVGSVLAVAGLSAGLFLLPGHVTRVEPGHPRPLPGTSPSPAVPPAVPPATPDGASSFPPATPDGPPGAPSSSGTPTATNPPATSTPGSEGTETPSGSPADAS